MVSKLAKSDDIDVAAPMLKGAAITDPDLKFIAETKSCLLYTSRCV